MKYDVIIIGTGVTGSSIAFELSKYNLKVLMLEERNDVAMVTTKANSGIVHAGYDPMPGTKMARLNVLGSELIHDLAPKLNIHYKNIGSLVIGKTEADHKLIDELLRRGQANGVKDLSVINQEEIRALEPNIAPEIDYALYAKTAAVISPWELSMALAQTAVGNGVELSLRTKVTGIAKVDDTFKVETTKGVFEATYVFNAAGLHADDVYDLLLDGKHPEEHFDITPVKGEYYLLDKAQGKLANTVIFQTPNELGKGVLVSPTVHGNLIVGPNAANVESKEDLSTKSAALAYVRTASAISVPNVNFRDNIRNFSGNRATIKGAEDFLIEESKVCKGFYNFAGIKSPGISCGPAFGIEAIDMLKASGAKLELKPNFELKPLPKFFKDLSVEEINAKIKENPLYGRIICRCETVSEGEIVDALHGIIPPCSIDGVKRRTNAGMGRCQGGFCGPKVLEIIKRELGLRADDVLQDGDGSRIVLEHTKGGDEYE